MSHIGPGACDAKRPPLSRYGRVDAVVAHLFAPLCIARMWISCLSLLPLAPPNHFITSPVICALGDPLLSLHSFGSSFLLIFFSCVSGLPPPPSRYPQPLHISPRHLCPSGPSSLPILFRPFFPPYILPSSLRQSWLLLAVQLRRPKLDRVRSNHLIREAFSGSSNQ